MDDLIERLNTELGDRYHVERELGLGGMAIVFLAQDLRHNRQVAIKVLRPELSASLGVDRFLREIEIAAGLQHPHILPLYDSGNADGLLFYVMPYVDGQTLRTRVAQGEGIPMDEALQYGREVADALDYAHNEGVVHRDIKPENVLLSQGHAVVADFGIARAVRAATDSPITVAGVRIGTPTYMSPEQIEGSESVDGRTDQYALGCVVHEMITGRPPYVGDSMESVFNQHFSGDIPSVERVRSDVPHGVSRAIRKSLAKDPADRFARAGEFGAAMEGRGFAGRSSSQSIMASRGLAVFGVVLLAPALTVTFRSRSSSAPPAVPRLAVLPFENLGAGDDEYVADGITEAITTRLSTIGDLGVISRQSATRYKSADKTMQEIAEDLGVQYLLVGTLRRERPADPTSRVRISPQLIRVSDDRNLWAGNFNVEDLTEIFTVYTEIGEEVARQLDLTLLEPAREALAARATDSEEAYDAYLRGRDHFTRRVAESEARNAVAMFERAVEADSNFAEALAALSHAYAWLAWDWDGAERLPEAEAAIARALQLAPDRSEVQIAAGYYAYYGRLDYERALTQFNAVRVREPNNTDVITAIGLIRRRQGQWEEAVRHFEEAFTLGPQDYFAAFLAGQSYAAMRRFDDAERFLDRAIAVGPELPQAYVEKAWLAVHRDGGTAEAWRVVDDAAEQVGSADLAPIRMWLHVLDGDFDAAADYAVVAPIAEAPVRGAWFVHHMAGRDAVARAYADSARVRYETLVVSQPVEPQLQAYLGTVHALLGNVDEAATRGLRGASLRPTANDAFTGPTMAWNLAVVYMLLGQTDDALDELTTLAADPLRIDVPPLALDPIWAPLWSDPRFQDLMR